MLSNKVPLAINIPLFRNLFDRCEKNKKKIFAKHLTLVNQQIIYFVFIHHVKRNPINIFQILLTLNCDNVVLL